MSASWTWLDTARNNDWFDGKAVRFAPINLFPCIRPEKGQPLEGKSGQKAQEINARICWWTWREESPRTTGRGEEFSVNAQAVTSHVYKDTLGHFYVHKFSIWRSLMAASAKDKVCSTAEVECRSAQENVQYKALWLSWRARQWVKHWAWLLTKPKKNNLFFCYKI